MRKSVLVVGACLTLGGCALPVPFQVASWALDAISVVATDKSLTDHGISVVTQKDCALHRVVTEDDNQVCHEVDDAPATVLVAGAEDAEAGPVAASGLGPRSSEIELSRVTDFEEIESSVASSPGNVAGSESGADVADFATAAGSRPAEQPVAVRINVADLRRDAEPTDRPYVKLPRIADLQVSPPTVDVVDVVASQAKGVTAKPRSGFYYVIGSFRTPDRAKRHMTSHSRLVPAVLRGRIGSEGREVFRVVVGPVQKAERKYMRKQITRAGIPDTWAIRVSADDWSVAAIIPRPQQAFAGASFQASDWPGLGAFMKPHGGGR